MEKREYNKKLIGFSSNMRKRPSPEEGKIWHLFLKYVRPRFHRQRIIGNFIVDFYCPKAMLVVEIDGIQHNEKSAVEYDRMRQQYLESSGYQVIRYSTQKVNADMKTIIDNFEFVLNKRLKEVESKERFHLDEKYKYPF